MRNNSIRQIIICCKKFPTLTNIADARSWFGLVNQVAWAYGISSVMQPFRELGKHNTSFTW